MKRKFLQAMVAMVAVFACTDAQARANCGSRSFRVNTN